MVIVNDMSSPIPVRRASLSAAPEPESAAIAVRLRFAPPGVRAAFALIGTSCIVAAVPDAEFAAALARTESVDAVARMYVRAWLNFDPGNDAIRLAAAWQAFQIGEIAAAEREIIALSRSQDHAVRRQARFLRLEFVERATYAIDPEAPARPIALAKLQSTMQELIDEDWNAFQLRTLARKTRDAGLPALAASLYLRAADQIPGEASELNAAAARVSIDAGQFDQAMSLYMKLAAMPGEPTDGWYEEGARAALANGRSDRAAELYLLIAALPGEDSAKWNGEAATLMIAAGRHERAAELYFVALEAATSRDVRREKFIAGLRALQSASKFDAAIAAADRYGAEFLTEIPTVEFLVRLAQSANRPAVAARYARQMMQLSLAAEPRRVATADRGWFGFAWLIDLLVPSANAIEPERRIDARPLPGGESKRSAISLPYDSDRYLLAYEIFLGNRNQRQARDVAEAAVRHAPDDPAWRKRYALVAEWDGAPAIALEQWHAYAQLSGDDAGWDAVLRLAPGLLDNERLIAALDHRHRRDPKNHAVLFQLLDALENVGRPRAALAILRDYAIRDESKPVLDRLAALTERLGEDAQALATYELIAARHGATAELAIKQAVLLYVKGTIDDAWQRLDRAKPNVPRTNRDFWLIYAQLSQFVARYDDSIATYKYLLEAEKPEIDDLANLIGLLQAAYPIEAARMAEHGYLTYNRRDWAQVALAIHAGREDWTSYARVHVLLKVADRTALESDHEFLGLRAQYFQAIRDNDRARTDLVAALKLVPAEAQSRRSLRQSLIWLLVGEKRAADLQGYLEAWRSDAESDPEFWPPFAAAHMLRAEPAKAVVYYARSANRRPDDALLLLAYAGALEQANQGERAWALRRRVWLDLRKPDMATKLASTGDDGRELMRSWVELSLRFGSIDESATLLRELLRRDDPKKLSPAAKELVLSWALQAEAHDAAHAFYLRQYAADIARGSATSQAAQASDAHPYWAALSIALVQDDRSRVVALLDGQADALPIYDRIDANRRVGREKQAEQLAFDALERSPADDELHLRFTETAIPAAAWNGVDIKRVRLGALSYNEETLRGAVNLTPSTRLGASIMHRNPSSSDGGEQLGTLPGRDNILEVNARQRFQADDLTIALTRRTAADSANGGRVEWRSQGESISTKVTAGRNQAALESTFLRLGGMKDFIEMLGTARISRREYVTGSLREDRFASQSGTRVGRGKVATLEVGHRFRTEYPDLTVRATAVRALYRTEGVVDETLARSLAPGIEPDTEIVMPKSFSLYGASIGFGEAYRDDYTRAIRPFADVGISENSLVGRGYNLRYGVAGSLFGSDHLALYFGLSKGSRGVAGLAREIGINYMW